MHTFKSEFAHSYKTYSFGYCDYAKKEIKDSLFQIYEKGYLPYSGIKNIKDTLYMARSARINLHEFILNSENRRIVKRFDHKFKYETIPLKQFDHKDKKFLEFCLNYFKKRHGKDIMPIDRLMTILDAGFITDIITYKNDRNEIVAYVFEASDKNMTHFWFSFFDLTYAYQSLGMWLMIDSTKKAKDNKKKYFYVGTVYGEKALYKTNFDFLEYWNGNKWIKDKKKLRARSRSDETRTCDMMDEWKEKQENF